MGIKEETEQRETATPCNNCRQMALPYLTKLAGHRGDGQNSVDSHYRPLEAHYLHPLEELNSYLPLARI
jgi:hypothetical protein